MTNNFLKILDVKFHPYSSRKVINEILKLLSSRNRGFIVTPNPEFLVKANKNDHFKSILNNAFISIPDGTGILWAAKFLSLKTSRNIIIKYLQSLWQLLYTGLSLVFYPNYCRTAIPERVTGIDIIYRIFDFSQNRGFKIYLLGAQPGVAKRAAAIIKNKYPGIQIVGSASGSPQKKLDVKTRSKINSSDADILLVAYGAPKQEYWMQRNFSNLSSVKLAIGVGGAFDFISGSVKRAPNLMRNLGLEWAYRLIKEPSRIIRIANATLYFPYLIFKDKLKYYE